MATIYVTKQFTSGTLKGLTYDSAMPGFKNDDEAAKWANQHRTTPVKANPAGGSSAYIIIEASFQKYWRY